MPARRHDERARIDRPRNAAHSRGVMAALIAGVLVLLVLFGGTKSMAVSELELGAGKRDEPVVTPLWNLVHLSQCATLCSLDNIGDSGGFNECYACTCLVQAAQNFSELISARSQCEFEKRRNK